MRRAKLGIMVVLAALAGALPGVIAARAEPSYSISMHGKPALAADFQHLPYANPDAPKGGKIDYAWFGTFDSVNPFILKGRAVRGPTDLIFGDLIFDRLMMRSMDEPFTFYPLVAKTIDTDDARSYVEFQLDERAKFSDGQPITPEDVIFTVELLRDKGIPRYGITVNKIDNMEKVGDHGVRFTFKQPDRELPLILAGFPVFPKHATDAENFDKSSLTPPVGSGPYIMESIKAGESVTFKRNPDYWAKDLPSKRGFDNYDQIRVTYYNDENAMFESFKKGLTDVMIDENSGRWANQYNFPAVQAGDIVKEDLKLSVPPGMLAIIMNTRRPVFANAGFREALANLFDFQWANRNLLSSAYNRTRSFFDNSELSTVDKPASDAEKALLAPFPDAVKPDIMANGWHPTESDGSGRDRNFLKAGFDKLKAAGYKMAGEALVAPDGAPASFEIMLNGSENQQIAVAWQQTLRRLGINLTIRPVDSSQFLSRQKNYDYDSMFFNYSGSLSPGVEQVSRFGSASRDPEGSFNFAGVANPAADAMIDAMLKAKERSAFVDAVHAYDRVLLSGFYVVPLYYHADQWVAHWKRIERPEKQPLNGASLPTWWHAQQ